MPPSRRPTRFPDLVNAAALTYLPISRPSFELLVKKLSIHHAFVVAVERGVPTISRTQVTVGGRNCYGKNLYYVCIIGRDLKLPHSI